MAAATPASEIYVPNLGFRPAAGALTLAHTVEFKRDKVSLWIGQCISAGRTELVCAFDGVNLLVEEAPVLFNVCPVPWWQDFSMALQDPSGWVISSQRLFGGGRAQRRSLTAFFESLPAETRNVELRIEGPLGTWHVPFELVPLVDMPVAMPIDVEATDANVRLAVTAVARTPDYTAVRVTADSTPPLRRVQGLGRGQPTGDYHDPFLESGTEGLRHPLRGRVGAQRVASGALDQVLVFDPLPPDSTPVMLRCDRVVVEEPSDPCVIAYPPAVGEYHLGRFTLHVVSTQPDVESAFGRAIALDIDVEGADRRWLSSQSVTVDDRRALVGWSRTGVIPNLHLNVLHPGYEPFEITLSRPIVETDGRWDMPLRI